MNLNRSTVNAWFMRRVEQQTQALGPSRAVIGRTGPSSTTYTTSRRYAKKQQFVVEESEVDGGHIIGE